MIDKKILLQNLGLLIIGVLCFALAHPTDLCNMGLPFLSYFAFIPVFLLTQRASWKTVWLYGFAYGTLCYCVFVSWLGTFNPASMPVIAGMYGLYLMVAFPLMKAVTVFFPKNKAFAQWIVWCAYEYVKTLGFSGFNYGVTAYSHWKFIPFIQAASLLGVFGLSGIITFPSAWFTALINDSSKSWKTKIYNHKISAIIWLVVYVSVLIFGFVSQKDYSTCETRTIALVQTNSDPWVGGEEAYKKDLNVLMNLSDEALNSNPNISFVVWPETAFVPRIQWHYEKRLNRNSFNLVNTLLTYIDSKPVPFVIGNDDGVMGYDSEGNYTLLDYNAALVFTPKENVIPPQPEKYRKMHLVPFTEHFPFKKQLPFVYKLLEENDTHFWEKGTEPVVFEIDGLKFSVPICFEDTFGYIGRRFVNNGARAFVNMSNDSWARSRACQLQHLSMAVFRSVENRVPSVRATASGETVFVDPNGRVTASIAPFEENYLVSTIPLITDYKPTIYTRFGDYAGVLFTIFAFILLIFGGIMQIYKKSKKEK